MAFSRVRAAWARISAFAGLVHATRGTARSLNDDLIAVHGITIEQYEILSRLARQADLAQPPLVTAANAQRELTTLEREGLVQRRASNVTLTDAGREKVHAARSTQLDELLGS